MSFANPLNVGLHPKITTKIKMSSFDDLIISGNTSVCLGIEHPFIYDANVAGGIWTSSNRGIADIDSITGELTPYQAGTFQVIYTVLIGVTTSTATLSVTVIDPTIPAMFSFPTTICSGTSNFALPNLSDNNIAGTWVPDSVSSTHTDTYMFVPSNGCNPIQYTTVTVISHGDLIVNSDEIHIPYSALAQNTPNILLNDTFNGALLTSNYLGATVTLNTTANNITANQDGTLHLPAGLQVGAYHLEYSLSTSCLHSNIIKVVVYVYDNEINAPIRNSFDTCYSASSYTTSFSVLDNVSVGTSTHANANNTTIGNLTAPFGFTINPNGTIYVPAGAPQGVYHFTYDLCATGSITGCATGIIFDLLVGTTVRANPDIFYFGTSGTYYGSAETVNTANVGSPNIINNDQYSTNCFLTAPNNGIQAVLGGNITNLTINQTGLAGNFGIDNNGSISVLNALSYSSTYPFTYTICDANNTTVCSSTNGLIVVFVDVSSKMSPVNAIYSKMDLTSISIAPNPSNEKVSIKFNSVIENETVLELFNMLRQKLFEDKINNIQEYILSLNDYQTGNYIVKLSDNDSHISKLITKE